MLDPCRFCLWAMRRMPQKLGGKQPGLLLLSLQSGWPLLFPRVSLLGSNPDLLNSLFKMKMLNQIPIQVQPENNVLLLMKILNTWTPIVIVLERMISKWHRQVCFRWDGKTWWASRILHFGVTIKMTRVVRSQNGSTITAKENLKLCKKRGPDPARINSLLDEPTCRCSMDANVYLIICLTPWKGTSLLNINHCTGTVVEFGHVLDRLGAICFLRCQQIVLRAIQDVQRPAPGRGRFLVYGQARSRFTSVLTSRLTIQNSCKHVFSFQDLELQTWFESQLSCFLLELWHRILGCC